MDRVDEDLLVLELVGKRLDDLARVDNVEDDGEEGVALDAATLAGDVLERAVGEAEVLRNLHLVVSDVLLEQDLVLLLENLDDDSTQELVEGVDAVFRIDGKGGVVLENELERTRDGVDTSREAAAVLAGASKAGAPALICGCGYRFCWDSAKGRRNTDGANSVGEGGGSDVVRVWLKEGEKARY